MVGDGRNVYLNQEPLLSISISSSPGLKVCSLVFWLKARVLPGAMLTGVTRQHQPICATMGVNELFNFTWNVLY